MDRLYTDLVSEYAYDCLEDKLIVGKTVKQACERHLRDLENSKLALFKWRFDEEKAQAIINYANSLTIQEGEEVIDLECYPFQNFILGSLIGWVTKDGGYRRFRESYVQLGRQNGKSFLNGILGTYLGEFSGYNYGKIFCIATKHEQAKIVWDEMVKFINGDADLSESFKVQEHKSLITCLGTNTKILALGRDTKSLDGFRALLAVIDEYHAHKDNQMFKLMQGGQKKAKQSLISVITTAGFQLEGACHQMYRLCKGILNGESVNDNKFIYIAELDEEDDTDDYLNWIKANPILEYDREALDNLIPVYNDSKKMGGKDWNDFQTKQLDMWVEFTETKYMPMTKFNECGCDKTLEDFRGKDCAMGLDASSGGDLTSVAFEFKFLEDGETKYFVHTHSFIPFNRIEEHKRTDNAPYSYWVERELLTATTAVGGIKTDYKEIIIYMRKIIKQYNLKLKYICYDQANVASFLSDLEEFKVTCYEINQNSKSLNDSVMDIKYECEAGNIQYNKNAELLMWCMNNCELTKPRQGNVMLDKNSRVNRIDEVACWVDVHKLVMRKETKPQTMSSQDITNWFNRGK
ncbi:terminase large subunit [Clostridium gasigenes]|uniref:terminase large subunit n=1 Tax=Clostridium gasigenes TaxID=94869 RepID=UPI001C0E55F5|nr:terminase TerL endonuclease subunit [Clostridium gasigenes]MBU3135056.1 terminase large subunit [Clostridium gasigenes]